MSNTTSVEPELPLLSSKFWWAVELPEAEDEDLWLLELDDRSDATESTDCGVDLPDPADNLGINTVDVHVMGDIGGDGVNGAGVWVNGTSNPKDCNKSFDLLSCALLRWQFTWLQLATFNHISSVQQGPYKSWLELWQTKHHILKVNCHLLQRETPEINK